MKGRNTFTKIQIEELERLIILRNNTAPLGQKAIRQRMRDIGFYGKDDWDITNLQLEDLNFLISSGRIEISDGGYNITARPKRVSVKSVKPTTKTSQNNFSEVEKKLEKARLKYKPNFVKYILIAEAPPANIERFFYYENVPEKDYLFLAVAQSLYPDLKDKFLVSGRSSIIKKEILQKFKDEGFYLLDLSELPLSLLTVNLSSHLPTLIDKIKRIANPKTKIILIKVNVYDIAFRSLQEEFENVVDVRIPFPLYRGVKLFPLKFNEALISVGYS